MEEVAPLEAVDPSDTVEASKEAATRRWDGMEPQRREQILHYFNTIPGKFTMGEREITNLSQMEFRVLRSDIQEAVLKSIVGWHWDYELEDPLPAAHIIFGLGGYTLSQAGELAIQTFSLMPEAARGKLVKTYSIWDDLKARGEGAVSGMTVQSAVSAAARRARRNYAAWRTSWDALTLEQKRLYFTAVRVYPRVTRMHERRLVDRNFDNLPDDVKAYLYDQQQVNEIAAKITAGRLVYYSEKHIRTLIALNREAMWPADKISQFVSNVERRWDNEPPEERAEILRFIQANDPLLFLRHEEIGFWGGYAVEDIPRYSQMRLFQLADSLGGPILGHLALYFSWWILRRMPAENIKFMLAGLDDREHILSSEMSPAGTPERMDQIDAAEASLLRILVLEEQTSYNQWVGISTVLSTWVRKLAYNSEDLDALTGSGRRLYANVRRIAEVRSRARFQAGAAVRVQGVANYCKVQEIDASSADHTHYHVDIYSKAPEGPQGDAGRVEYGIREVAEDFLSEWAPWPLATVLNGSLWNDKIALENRNYWLRAILEGARISVDSQGIAGERGAVASRQWDGIGEFAQKKFLIRLAQRGLISEISWGRMDVLWTDHTTADRAGHILNAMATMVFERLAIEPSNSPRLQAAMETNNFWDLPLDYIYGITLSRSITVVESTVAQWALVYGDLIARYPHANDEDAIYFAIGAGLEPQIAVGMVRPRRLAIPLLAEWKAFALVKGYNDKTVARGAPPTAWAHVFSDMIQEGRAAVPELPVVAAEEELNAGWGASNYQNRYMMLIGAIGQDAVLQAYAEHEYQPPPSYIQAASTSNITAIRDTAIVQRLTGEFETAGRNLDTLRLRGEEILTFIATSLNQTRQTGETEANRRAGVRWDALNASLRDFIMRYVRDEFVTEIPILDEYPTWDRLAVAAKNAIVTLSDWELAERYGAAKLLETQWAVVMAETRRKWILGLRLGLSEGEFERIMSNTWVDYNQVPSRFTSEIILKMVNGIEGDYGQGALNALRLSGEARNLTNLVSGTPLSAAQLNVCDFIKFAWRGAVFYGFIVYIQERTIYGSWRSDFYEAYDIAPRLTLVANRGIIVGETAEATPVSPSSEMQNIIRYERNHPLPILADSWGGGAMDREEAAAIRAPKIARMMLEAEGDLPDRLLALLYPGGQADINVAFHARSSWSSMPLDSRSWMIRTLIEERVDTTLGAGGLTGHARTMLDQWLLALGGQTLVDVVRRARPSTWPLVLLPIIAYSIRKARDEVTAPTGAVAIPWAPPEAAPPTPTPPPPVAPPPATTPLHRITEVMMREAWDRSTHSQRARVLRVIQYTSGESASLSRRDWEQLTPAQRTRLRRELRQGTWEIRRGRVAVRVAPTPTPAPPSAYAPPVEAPEHPQDAWDRLTPAGRVPLLRHFEYAQRVGLLPWSRLSPQSRRALTAAWRRNEWGLEPPGVVWIRAPEAPATPPPAPAPDARPNEWATAWNRLTPPQRVRVLMRVQPSIDRVLARHHSRLMFAFLNEDIQRALMMGWIGGEWTARGAVAIPTLAPTPPVKPPAARPPPPPPEAPPSRRPAAEEFFEDPFRRAIEANIAEHYRNWERAQLDVTLAELQSIANALGTDFYIAREGGHGVPVPYLLVPLNMARIAEDEGRHPEIRNIRAWQRVKNAVRSRRGQALVSLQVGEFYKSGKWWRQNTVPRHPKKRANQSLRPKCPHCGSREAVRRSMTGNWECDKCQREFLVDPFDQRDPLQPIFQNQSFIGRWTANPAPAQFQMVRFRSDVYPIKVIDEFLQRHAEGWVTSFQSHYNIDRLPEGKRVYIAISTAPEDKPKPLIDKIIGVMGITRNRYDNIDDVFVAVHTGYRRMGVGRQLNILLFDIARKWINPETGRGARRVYLLVKDANEASKRTVTSVGFAQIEQFLNTAGELVNRYVKELYEPPRENP
jgi:ribosomal protein L37AE/L43A/RimJ/RimL family protein N-acetyltransferase